MSARKLEICQKEGVIASIETNMQNIMQNLKEIKDEIKEFKNNFEKFVIKYEQEKKGTISELNKYSHRNFASKWTEKILLFIGGAVGTILIGAVLSLIIK